MHGKPRVLGGHSDSGGPVIPLSVAQLAGITGAALDQVPDPGVIVAGPVVIDSREARPGALFAALPGTRADGHDFAAAAVAAGATAVLASRPVGVPALIVSDVQAALGDLAAAVVRRLPGLTIAGDHRVGGQDHHQGPDRAAGRDAGPDRLQPGQLQQRDRPPADRAAGDRADSLPHLRAVGPRAGAHRGAVRHRAAAAGRGAVRRPRARRRVRRHRAGGQGQERAARGAAAPAWAGWPC